MGIGLFSISRGGWTFSLLNRKGKGKPLKERIAPESYTADLKDVGKVESRFMRGYFHPDTDRLIREYHGKFKYRGHTFEADYSSDIDGNVVHVFIECKKLNLMGRLPATAVPKENAEKIMAALWKFIKEDADKKLEKGGK